MILYYTYSACYGVQYTVIWASIDFEFLACVYISTRPQAKLKLNAQEKFEIYGCECYGIEQQLSCTMCYIRWDHLKVEIVSTYDIMIWTNWTFTWCILFSKTWKSITSVTNIVTGKFWTTLSLNETSNAIPKSLNSQKSYS